MDDGRNKSSKELEALLEMEFSTQAASLDRPLPRIVVVDDEERMLETLQLFLSDQYELRVAAGAKQALEVINEDTHAVLLDIKMPGRDGFLAFLDIKDRHPFLPVIFHSAFQDLKDPYEIMNYYRPFGYVTKSASNAVLLDVLASAVEYSRQTLHNAHRVEKLQARECDLLRRLAESTGEVERLRSESMRLRAIDELTGLMNRRTFFEKLTEESHRSRENEASLSMALAYCRRSPRFCAATSAFAICRRGPVARSSGSFCPRPIAAEHSCIAREFEPRSRRIPSPCAEGMGDRIPCI
ncbi:MAG: response regulator [Myxococcota bacterium]|nr:response regulator [Myxococcota bacterium]